MYSCLFGCHDSFCRCIYSRITNFCCLCCGKWSCCRCCGTHFSSSLVTVTDFTTLQSSADRKCIVGSQDHGFGNIILYFAIPQKRKASHITIWSGWVLVTSLIYLVQEFRFSAYSVSNNRSSVFKGAQVLSHIAEHMMAMLLRVLLHCTILFPLAHLD